MSLSVTKLHERSPSTDWNCLLYLIYRAGATGVSGRVRLQKIVFILKEGLHIPFTVDFTKKKYGPYSDALMDLVTRLRSEGYVDEKMKGNEFDYVLTDNGRRLVEQVILEKLDKSVKSRIDNVVGPLSETGVGHLTHLAYAIQEVKK